MSNKGIVLSGIKETQKALEKFDKDAVKAFTKLVNSELNGAKKRCIRLCQICSST